MAQPAPARRSADDKRAAILAAALTLFGRYGYRRTSIDDIAREAGIAKGTVYLYVETKEALFRALAQSLLDRVLDTAERAATAKEPLVDRLLAILDAKFGFFHDLLHRSPHALELMDSKSRLCADVFARGDAAYLALVQRTLAAAVRRGEIAPRRHGLTAADVAQLLLAGAHGQDPTLPALVYRTRLRALVQVIVAGLAPR